MGGGDEGGSTGTPTDLLGGQYATFSGGTPGYDWKSTLGGIGKGLQQTGASGSGQTTPASLLPTSQFGSQDYGMGQQGPIQIQQNNIADAIMRILGGY